MPETRPRREPPILLAIGVTALIVSAIRPFEQFTWLLEVAPILIALPVLVFSYRRFPLTPLLYRLILLHALILMIGGHYTYARVPLGYWAEDLLGLARNHYDRLGHFAQGFVPAMIAREVLRRRTPLKSNGWLFFLSLSIALAISAFYELVEWWTAVAAGSAATDFLGTQGDVWDTQWDMCMALVGAFVALLLLAGEQDREIARLRGTSPP